MGRNDETEGRALALTNIIVVGQAEVWAEDSEIHRQAGRQAGRQGD